VLKSFNKRFFINYNWREKMNLLKKYAVRIDILFIYTFFALFFKNLFVAGFLLDKSHTALNFIRSLMLVFRFYAHRPFYYIGVILVFVSLGLFFKNRKKFAYYIVLNIFLSLLLAADIWYVRGFSTLPTLHILSASKLLSNVFDTFLALIIKKDILFFIDIPFLIILYILTFKRSFEAPRRPIIATILFFTALIMVFFIAPLSNKLTRNIPSNWILYRFDATSTTYHISPIGYNLYSTYLYFKDKQTLKLSNDDKSEINSWFKSKKEDIADNKYKNMFKNKNLLIIQVESLENFVINKKIDGQEITPNLNKLLGNSIYFSNIHEQTGQGNSSDSDFITNTSVYPVQIGTVFLNYSFNKFNSLPNLLRKNGYSSVAIHPIAGSFWNWGPSLTSIGFDKCIDLKSFKGNDKLGIGMSDATALPQAVDFIKKEKQPFYAFVVTMSSHTPFVIPDELKKLKLNAELDKTLVGNYLQLIHYTDEQISLFLDKLGKEGLLENTLVAIYGDHEGIHKFFPKELDKIKQNPELLFNNTKELPLILYNPAIKGEEIKTIGGQVDFLPTLCYLLGVDEKDFSNTAMGRILLKTNKNFAVLRDKSIISENMTEDAKAKALKGLIIADKVIRGNYFKNYGTK
jgi:lipoteichoic acid synthase